MEPLLVAALDLPNKNEFKFCCEDLLIIISELDRSGIDDGYAILLVYVPDLFQNLLNMNQRSSLTRNKVERLAVGLKCLSTLYQMARAQLDKEIGNILTKHDGEEEEEDDDDEDAENADHTCEPTSNDESSSGKRRKVESSKKRKSLTHQNNGKSAMKKPRPSSSSSSSSTKRASRSASKTSSSSNSLAMMSTSTRSSSSSSSSSREEELMMIDRRNGVYVVNCYAVATWAGNCDELIGILERPQERLVIDHSYLEAKLGEANIRVERNA
jgi:hypothetical protein